MSGDGVIFEEDEMVLRWSETIGNALDDLDTSQETAKNRSDEEVIRLLQVRSNILGLILKWACYHRDDPREMQDEEPIPGTGRCSTDICSFDEELLKVDQGTLYELVVAANYLAVPKLVDVICKTVANMIKGQSASDIRQTFNVNTDDSDDEGLDLTGSMLYQCQLFWTRSVVEDLL